jgi:hypothetical protein
MKRQYKELSEAERWAITEELRMPVGELFAMLFGAIMLILFVAEGLKLR